MINKEVYVEIQILKKQGLSLRQIAREVGCAVNTIRRHLAQEAEPKYERKVQRATKLKPYEPYLLERVAAARPHWIPATVLYQEIRQQGYTGGLTRLRSFLYPLKHQREAEPLVRAVADHLRNAGVPVRLGEFGADMLVEIDNDGPVTIVLERGAAG